MSPKREYAGRFHAAYTSADYSHCLRSLSLLNIVLLPLHHLRVYSAAGKVQGVEQILVVGNALVMRHIEASVVAQDAGPDLIFSSFKELVDPLRIRQELPRKACSVDAAPRDCLRRRNGIHAPCADHRDIHKFADVFHIFQVAVLGHVDRRVRPVPCVISSIVAVEHIIARVLKIFCRPLGLFHVAPGFLIFLTGKRAAAEALRLGDHAVAQGHGEIIPADILYRLNDLHREAVAVLERSAVFIRAVIDIFKCKLVEQISLMHSMDLHTVHARLFEKSRALGKSVHEFVDLFHRHGSRGHLIRPSVGCGRRAGCDLVQVHDRL